MLNRTTLFALAAVLAVAIAPAAALAKAGHGGGHGGKGGHGGGKHAHHHHHKHHHHKHVRWHRWKTPILIGTTGVATYSAYAATTGSCNCLTKSYLENGTVVFKDLCTQEMAMNPPADKQAQNAQ